MVIRHIDVDDYDDAHQQNTVGVSVSLTVRANSAVNVSTTVNVNTQPQPHLLTSQPQQLAPAPVPQQIPSLRVVPSAEPLVVMELDRGLLPWSLEFSEDWGSRVDPKDVGRELAEAYRTALNDHHDRTSGRAGRHPPRHSPDHRISVREQTIMLLETATWNKYCRVQDELLSDGDYLINGALTQYGRAVVTLTGNCESIHSITVSPHWSGCADPQAIEAEILWCVNQIRALRPKFIPEQDWSGYTDDELLELQRLHKRQLIAASAF